MSAGQDALLPIADVFARTLWAEARSQGRAGMEAVACVILNRAAHPRWWGHDIRSVCLHPFQFSCWNADDPQAKMIRHVGTSDPNFRVAVKVAEHAMGGGLRDATNGADSYYAPLACVAPKWAVGTPCAVIGAHRFYRVEIAAPGGPPQAAAHGSAAAITASHAPPVAPVAAPGTVHPHAAELAQIEREEADAVLAARAAALFGKVDPP